MTCQWWGGGSVISQLPSYWVVVSNNFSFIAIRWAHVLTMNNNVYVLIMHAIPKCVHIKHKYFQCNWWRLFRKPVVCLILIFMFSLSMVYLTSLKLSIHLHVDSDWWGGKGCDFSPTLLLGSCFQQFLFYYDKVSRCACYEYQ